MSQKDDVLKMIAGILFLILIVICVYVYVTRYIPETEKHKCPPCECKKLSMLAQKPIKPIKEKSKKEIKHKKTIVQKNADTLFVQWLEECKKESKQNLVNLLACVRWIKLRKYLKVDYADQAMLIRRKSGHLILNRIGRTLCESKAEKHNRFISKELSAVYKNMRNNIRHLKNIKRRNPDLEVPAMKMCVLKDGKLTWDYP